MIFARNRVSIRTERLEELRARERSFFDMRLLSDLTAEQRSRFIDLLPASAAQLRQDLVALVQTGFKTEGFFVEFGATDGRTLSNSWLLESQFGWRGILSEPARQWHKALDENRSAVIDKRCVWSATGETLSFVEAPRGENSGISAFVPTRRRMRGTSYDVDTVSLNDLLAGHDAPPVIDFMSVDTEGSEFEILNALDFSRWRFNFLAIEHNFGPTRAPIRSLMEKNGYVPIYPEVSRFDDWFVPAAS